MAGFKRAYKGEIVEEIYTKLDQSDFSVELARIRSLDPDALFQFHPGGAGINLTKQFANSGLAGKIKMITPIYSMDDRMLAATGSAGKGFYLSSLWSADRTIRRTSTSSTPSPRPTSARPPPTRPRPTTRPT